MKSSRPDPSLPLRPARPDVIDEEFDGEAVLVNLRTGCYYALDPAASVLWAHLGPGRSLTELAAVPGLDQDTLAAFVQQLVDEELVVPAERSAGALADPAPLDAAPTLLRFTDMQDLLRLDPIHDIDLDGDGWPVADAGDPDTTRA